MGVAARKKHGHPSQLARTCCLFLLLLVALGMTNCRGRAPATPTVVFGPTTGDVDVSYEFSTATIDPEDDSVRYQFDWGDSLFEWTDYRVSGALVRVNHVWPTRGTHNVRVMAEDRRGNSSGWSAGLTVSVAGYPSHAVASLSVGNDPNELAVTPDGECIYITEAAGDSLHAYYPRNGTIAEIQLDSPGTTVCPYGAVVSPDGKYLYVAGYVSGKVYVVRTSDNTVVATIPLGGNLWDVTLLPDGSYLYVTSSYDIVWVIRTSDNTVTDSITVRHQPKGIVAGIDGSRLYVACNAADDIAVVRALDNFVEMRIPIGGGWGAADATVLPNGEQLYVSNADRGRFVAVMHTGGNALMDTIPLPGGSLGIAALPGSRFVCVVCRDSNQVAVIRVADRVVAARVRVGRNPHGIAVAPDGERIYVTNKGDHSVTVIGY